MFTSIGWPGLVPLGIGFTRSRMDILTPQRAVNAGKT